jgi:hypothetical protein
MRKLISIFVLVGVMAIGASVPVTGATAATFISAGQSLGIKHSSVIQNANFRRYYGGDYYYPRPYYYRPYYSYYYPFYNYSYYPYYYQPYYYRPHYYSSYYYRPYFYRPYRYRRWW